MHICTYYTILMVCPSNWTTHTHTHTHMRERERKRGVEVNSDLSYGWPVKDHQKCPESLWQWQLQLQAGSEASTLQHFWPFSSLSVFSCLLRLQLSVWSDLLTLRLRNGRPGFCGFKQEKLKNFLGGGGNVKYLWGDGVSSRKNKKFSWGGGGILKETSSAHDVLIKAINSDVMVHMQSHMYIQYTYSIH